jgi:hypothetical protein
MPVRYLYLVETKDKDKEGQTYPRSLMTVVFNNHGDWVGSVAEARRIAQDLIGEPIPLRVTLQIMFCIGKGNYYPLSWRSSGDGAGALGSGPSA